MYILVKKSSKPLPKLYQNELTTHGKRILSFMQQSRYTIILEIQNVKLPNNLEDCFLALCSRI